MIFSRCVLLALLVCTNAFGAPDNAQLRYPFSVESQKDGDGYRVVALNLGPAPVSVKVSITEFEGIATDQPTPLFTEVAPGDRPVVLLRVQRAVKGEPYTFRTFSTWMVGKLDAAQANDAEYRLPFENHEAFSFSQVPDGPITTHHDAVSRYAVDIAMPQGTSVVAARGGIVISTEASREIGALDPALLEKANEVRILHADGTIATYAHFAHQGIFVVPGQRVSAGAEIGLAGSTGYSSGPHLHLAIQTVKRVADEFALVSLPFRFVNGNPLATYTPRYNQPARAEYGLPPPVGATGGGPAEPATAPIGGALHKMSMHPEALLEDSAPDQALLAEVPPGGWLAGMVALAFGFRASTRKRVRVKYGSP